MMLTSKTPIQKIAGIGPKIAQKLEKLGILTISDLLHHYPYRFEDFSKISKIGQIKPGTHCVKGKILEIKSNRTFRKKMFITQAIIQDATGSIKVVWFHQPYLTKMFKRGSQVLIAGRVDYGYAGLAFQNPTIEKYTKGGLHSGRIVPIYPETAGLNSRWLRRIIASLLKLTDKIPDYLPKQIKKEYDLQDLPQALKQVHFPDSFEKLEIAKNRIAFDELYLLQLKMLRLRQKWQKMTASKIQIDLEAVKKLVKKLPFKLTNSQRKAAWEILQDLSRKYPMNRLLEGDVGSGKTVVAAIAMLAVAKSGLQSMMMAPTEILAQQHFHTLKKVLAPFRLKIALLTSSKAEAAGIKNAARPKIIEKIKNGQIPIVVGTHALIVEKMSFEKLGLAIIDEQHRFGVEQRTKLHQKAKGCPHLLSMSATPIPRSLTLALYGDLDLSIIDEMPKGRLKIATYLVPAEKRRKAYEFIAKQIRAGRQIFVICPLIEESDRLGVKSVETEYCKLKTQIFPKFKIGQLHGKMKPKEKEKIMANFLKNKYNILVSTSVVEVGVDVPNASVMMIEGAERFGLAQLHQFRGRVGRAEHKSYCFIFCESPTTKIWQRLSALTRINDGFKLAEKDLKLRGPGEIDGIRQHGLVDLKMAKLTDLKMVKLTREAAEKTLKIGLENLPLLENKIKEYNKNKNRD